MTWEDAIPFFTVDELACACCGKVKLSRRFAAALAGFRMRWDQPLRPTSVCRCPAHNEAVGGHPKSMHLTDDSPHETEGTLAADIYWHPWPTGKKLTFARRAKKYDFSVGLNVDFCHIDFRHLVGLPQTVFEYDNWDRDLFTVEDVTR